MGNERSGGSERAPSQAEVIGRALRAFGSDLRVCLPGYVVKYDAASQAADIQIGVKLAYLDEEDNRQVESWPVVPHVPVEFPGGGDYRLTFPICDGNTKTDGGDRPPATVGLLFFSDFSMDRWLAGPGAQQVDPEIDHQHALVDAVFVPGLRTFGRPLSSCPTDHATLGLDGGVQAHFRKSIIALGDESGNQFVALAQKVLDELNAIKNAFNGHTHAAGSLTAGSTAVTGATAGGPTYNPSSVAASQVKAK